MEIAEKGPRACPAASRRRQRFSPCPLLPEYERDLDHAGLIRALDGQSLKRGEAVYGRVCVNCHGTKEQPGSMPTAPRLRRREKFKNGADPLRMYQTLTHASA